MGQEKLYFLPRRNPRLLCLAGGGLDGDDDIAQYQL